MVRVNVGIDVKDLTDEHLRAENVEIQMLLKFIEKYPIGNIPSKFSLNKGHISFFRDKGNYLLIRLTLIQNEMVERRMKLNKELGIDVNFNIPSNNMFNYVEQYNDSEIIATRIIERIINPLRKKNKYRYYGKEINDCFIERYEKYMRCGICE
jgi:deoxyribonuclease (pyrimidine dimer)